jgi:hypothetical protein
MLRVGATGTNNKQQQIGWDAPSRAEVEYG